MPRLELCRATPAEDRAALAGDELMAAASAQLTHAITIAAPPERVWPWLVQIGSGRAGWYSYDRIDNGGVPSTREIKSELQHVAVGDVFPALPGARDAFVVLAVAPQQSLVLGVPGSVAEAAQQDGDGGIPPTCRVTWSFALAPAPHGRTRLIVRGRVGDLSILRNDGRSMLAPLKLSFLASLLPLRLIVLLARPGHLLMERKMLLGIKQRAEGAPCGAATNAAAASGSAQREPAVIVPFPPLQHLMTDWLELEHRRHTMHALLEVDITDARRAIHAYRARTRAPLSLTAYLVYCLAQAVTENTAMQACRLGRRRLVLFAEVDVGLMVEREVKGVKLPAPHVIRAANTKSLDTIQQEIESAKRAQWTPSLPAWLRPLLDRGLSVWLTLPPPLRRLALTSALRHPYRRKRLIGTVGATSVGMFGRGTGWGVAPMLHPLTLVVGGLARKPGMIGDHVEAREYLCLTLTFDHDVIDGAPAARFAERLKELIEDGLGLHDQMPEPANATGPISSSPSTAHAVR